MHTQRVHRELTPDIHTNEAGTQPRTTRPHLKGALKPILSQVRCCTTPPHESRRGGEVVVDCRFRRTFPLLSVYNQFGSVHRFPVSISINTYSFRHISFRRVSMVMGNMYHPYAWVEGGTPHAQPPTCTSPPTGNRLARSTPIGLPVGSLTWTRPPPLECERYA